MKHKDKKKGIWKDKQNRKPKRNRNNRWKDKPFTCNMLMLLFSWNKSKEARQERTAKTQGRFQKQRTKQQGRKKKTKREREREREVKKEKWMKPRRKKGRHREMNKNNPFSEEKHCFSKNQKKTKKQKGLGKTSPKHTCRVALTPNPRRKRREE